MTAKRVYFSLVCLPRDKGGLIAIGGYFNGNYVDVVESLAGEDVTGWRWLALLTLPLSSTCGGVYFKQRILAVLRFQTCFLLIPRPLEDLANGSP